MVDYQWYIESQAWASKRQEKIASVFCWNSRVLCDNCRCFVMWNCIDVHHMTYDRLGAELMEDLRVLCYWCHKHIHGRPVPNDRDCTPATWTEDELRAVFVREFLECRNFDDALDAAVYEVIPIIFGNPDRNEPREMSDILRDWWKIKGRRILGPDAEKIKKLIHEATGK